LEKRVEQVLPGSGRLGVWEGMCVAQIMYTHVSKCKNNKIKGEKKVFPISFPVEIEETSFKSLATFGHNARLILEVALGFLLDDPFLVMIDLLSSVSLLVLIF
jgi:hypothetical protein